MENDMLMAASRSSISSIGYVYMQEGWARLLGRLVMVRRESVQQEQVN